MNRVEELIERLCPDGVEYKKIKDVFKRLRGTSITAAIMKQIAKDGGNIRIFAGGKTIIDANEDDIPNPNITRIPAVLVQSRGVIDFVYYDKPFTFKNEMWAYTCDNTTQLKYLYYYLKNNLAYFRAASSKMGSLPQISIPVTDDFKIPLPPLEVQNEIVKILDNFTQLEAELEAELEARKKQYEYYLKSLVTYDEHSVQWKKLGDIAEIGTGSSNSNEGLTEGPYPFYVRSQTPLRMNNYEFDEVAIITAGDGVGVGKVLHYVEGKYALHQRAYRIHPIDKHVHPKYVYYYMKGTFLDYIKKSCFHSSVTSIRRPMMNNYLIPLPPLEEQTRIVSILDRFDTLCNDLTKGLPAEIEARKKQYEYYREKLLTFKKKECSA